MIDVVLSFSLETIHIKSPHRPSEPDCYVFDVKVPVINIILIVVYVSVLGLWCQGLCLAVVVVLLLVLLAFW